MDKTVYIVHCVDTEGPLYESLEETFKRIKYILGYDILPSKENLKKLQNKEMNLDGNEDAICNLVAKSRLKTNETWDQIDDMLDKITNEDYRNFFVDSNGGGWIYNWFCMDHVGFKGYNPRRRDAGFHNIFDHYNNYIKKNKNNFGDIIQWHYHPVSLSGHYHSNGTAYMGCSNIFEILNRKIIDRNWFPAAYRPGFHTERPDSNWFLEQWLPFDYANQAVKGIDTNQPDMAYGRLGDWRKAPKEWMAYHPSHDDYQIQGSCRRWIARCLNMEARLREITLEDIYDGFRRGQQGQPTIISFTNHDFRNMIPEIDKLKYMIRKASECYPDVDFIFSNAVSAMRNALKLNPVKPMMKLKLIKHKEKNEGLLTVITENDIFGPQPYLAIKTVTGQYYWDNFDFQDNNKWTYTFDWNTISLNALEKVGVAANSAEGVTEVLVYDAVEDFLNENVYND